MKQLFPLFFVVSSLIASAGLRAETPVEKVILVMREVEFHPFYRAENELLASLSRIPNMRMNFREMNVNAEAVQIEYGRVFENYLNEKERLPEDFLPEGLSAQDLARLLDWNWAQLTRAWRSGQNVEMELKGLEQLKNFETGLSKDYFVRPNGIVSFSFKSLEWRATGEIDSDGDPILSLWILFGTEDPDARSAMLNQGTKAFSSREKSVGLRESYSYIEETRRAFGGSRGSTY